jgi:peptide/nickel transport system permease protein
MSGAGSSVDAGRLVPPAVGGNGPVRAAPAAGLYRQAMRRLRRNKVALLAGVVFLLIVACCLAAPLYASYIAHTGPDVNHITETIQVGGKNVDVVSQTGIPIGPTWHSKFFLGADLNGRDVAVRLLYGGRNSLFIGFTATAITMVVAVAVGLVAGYLRGWVDSVLTRLLDVIWAYPAILLGVAIGTSLALGGIKLGLFKIGSDSLFIPAIIIGFVNIPYVAKPIRGQVLALREKEFIEAARGLGEGALRVMLTEILPNITSTVIVFIPLMIANSILLEAGLSFLGAGVQPPNPSWGTMISDGVALITATPSLILAPGLALVIAVFCVNLFGEGLRDALDSRMVIGAARR